MEDTVWNELSITPTASTFKGYPLWDPSSYGTEYFIKGNRAALSCLSQGKKGPKLRALNSGV